MCEGLKDEFFWPGKMNKRSSEGDKELLDDIWKKKKERKGKGGSIKAEELQEISG